MIELERLAHELTIPQAGPLQRLNRTISLAKHYRWSQLLRRGWNVTRARFRKNSSIHPAVLPATLEWDSLEKARCLAQIIVGAQASAMAQVFQNLKCGRIARLNQSVDIGWPVDWQSARNQSHLWRFQLQYHEFLLPLAAASPSHPKVDDSETDATSAWDLIWSVVEAWLDQFPPEKTRCSDDAWHPYCISRRVPVWIWLLSLGNPSPALQHRMLVSMYQQIEHLHGNLEKDLGGNHLLENLTAIALGAAVIRSARTGLWQSTVLRELRCELDSQILPHGEHFELAPMYHCQVLGCLLRMGSMCEMAAPQLTESCRNKAGSMLNFLKQTVHPDGEIALLGDSGFGEAPSVREIQKLALLNQLDFDYPELSGSTPSENGKSSAVASVNHFHECGSYWIYRDNIGGFVIFDRGDLAAAGLPAHGHCDLLGFEASVGGRRWFVDSGNFNYESDSMRSYCRSSLAHNVVTCGQQNHADIWSRFRMGARAKVVDTRVGFQEGFHWTSARVTGFPHNGKRCWNRLFAISPDQQVWICADRMSGSASGHDSSCTGYLHLSPGLNLLFSNSDPAKEFQEIELSDGVNRRRVGFYNCHVQIADGWYCPEFGKRFPNRVLIYRCLEPASTFGWVMSALTDMIVTADADSITWHRRNRTFRFEWK